MRSEILTLVIVAILVMSCSRRSDTQPASASTAVPMIRVRPGREAFVGSTACAYCHQAQSDAYAGSHHAKALVQPSAELAKARFNGGHFTTKLGGTTEFALSNGAPVVSTSLGGRSTTFPISYISGVWPLEQYVVSTERGKLQALGVSWDSRSVAEGGGHWFHVYGADGMARDDSLFFTSAAQNWNHMCAECHSTWVERGYDVSADRFATRWAELSVGCEACHGPGAEHVRSARAGGATAIVPMPARLKRSEPWTPSGSGSPTPRARDDTEVEVCAPCHSLREPLKEGFLANDPFLDSFAPELLVPGHFHADGQVAGEVYEWGSFLQSKMYQSGVRCSDCHEPHSGKPYAQSNALCVRCHESQRFDVATHSHHVMGKPPLCIDCHMPPNTFMQIDERRDHSIRIPRPDLSVAFGTPNACNGCHGKESATWARDQVARWFPGTSSRPHFAAALAKDRAGSIDAARELRKVALDPAVPAIARATALERVGHYSAQKTAEVIGQGLRSVEPLVVYGAVLGSAELAPVQRARLLLSVLDHPVRAVRVAAAKLLAGVPPTQLPEAERPALERAFAEVTHSFSVSASRAETHVEQGAFELARGSIERAERSLQTALRLQPCLAEAHLNLAELARLRGDEAAAERAIRGALSCRPENAAAHHALGLWQVRAQKSEAALASLKKAVALAPENARFGYVLAVALHGSGVRGEAIRVLEAVLHHRPNDADTLRALASYLRESGENGRAAETLRELEQLSE